MALCAFRDDHPALLLEKILVHLLKDSEVRMLARTSPRWRDYIVLYFDIPRPLIYRCVVEDFLSSKKLLKIARDLLEFRLEKHYDTLEEFGAICDPQVFSSLTRRNICARTGTFIRGGWRSGNLKKIKCNHYEYAQNSYQFLHSVFESFNLGAILFAISVSRPMYFDNNFIELALRSGDVDIVNLTLSLIEFSPYRIFNLPCIFWSGSVVLLEYVKQIVRPNDQVLMSQRAALLAIEKDHADMLELYYQEYYPLYGENLISFRDRALRYGAIRCLRFLRDHRGLVLDGTAIAEWLDAVFGRRDLKLAKYLFEEVGLEVDISTVTRCFRFGTVEEILYLKRFVKQPYTAYPLVFVNARKLDFILSNFECVYPADLHQHFARFNFYKGIRVLIEHGHPVDNIESFARAVLKCSRASTALMDVLFVDLDYPLNSAVARDLIDYNVSVENIEHIRTLKAYQCSREDFLYSLTRARSQEVVSYMWNWVGRADESSPPIEYVPEEKRRKA